MSNVSVCVRIRPLNASEAVHGSVGACLRRTDHESFTFKDEKEGEQTFTFDRVFYEDSIQADVFQIVAMPIVRDAMHAINGTVLAYGQTGAGKTYSMEGSNIHGPDISMRGIIPRVAQYIFQFIETADQASEFLIKLSMVEIHMEKIRDLLDTTKDNLQVKENKAKGIFVAGVSERYLQTEGEMLSIIQAGIANRAVGATLMNAESSRSHCVFLFTIQQTNIEDRSVKTGKLYLVDLAGSEKVEKTGAEGRFLCEARTINKSLSALGNVINALTSEKSSHIPYRDSKLTRILQESLGGNSRTTLLCCCSPSFLHASETLSTLRFGTRAKQIKNKPKVNTERGHEFEQLLQKSEQECEQLRAQVLMANARLRSLNQVMSFETEGTSHDDSLHRISFQEKLTLMLPKKNAPTLDDMIAILKVIFVEEGLIKDISTDTTSRSSMDYGFLAMAMKPIDLNSLTNENEVDGDKLVLVEEDTSRTIAILQSSLEDLNEEFEKLEKENGSLKMELLACSRLLDEPSRSIEFLSPVSGRRSMAKPVIVCPVRGGGNAVCKADLPHQPQRSNNSDAMVILETHHSQDCPAITWSAGQILTCLSHWIELPAVNFREIAENVVMDLQRYKTLIVATTTNHSVFVKRAPAFLNFVHEGLWVN